MREYLEFDRVTLLIPLGILFCYLENGIIRDIILALIVLLSYMCIRAIPADNIGLISVIISGLVLLSITGFNLVMVVYYIRHSDELSGPIAAMYFAMIVNLAREIAAWKFMFDCYNSNKICKSS